MSLSNKDKKQIDEMEEGVLYPDNSITSSNASNLYINENPHNEITSELNLQDWDIISKGQLTKVINYANQEEHIEIFSIRDKLHKSIYTSNIREHEQLRKIIKRKWYIIDPTASKIKPIFDFIIINLLIIDFILSPYEFFKELSFNKTHSTNDKEYKRELIFDIFFIIELILNFFTGYYDHSKGFIITDMKLIALHYLKYGLIFDLISVTPFYVSLDTSTNIMFLRFVKLYRYPSIIAKIRGLIIRFFSLFISNIKLKQQITQILIFFLALLYILHLCACIYLFLGLYFIKNKEQTWVQVFILTKGQQLKDVKMWVIYVASIYQICQTFSTTGYGDLTPQTNVEIIFILFCEIVNCGLFAYFLTCVIEILCNKLDTFRFKYQTNAVELRQWITQFIEKLPQVSKEKNLHRSEIWRDVKRYYTYFYKTSKNFSWIRKFGFMEYIKPRDRKELLEYAFGNVLMKFNEFFDGISNYVSKNKIILNLETFIEMEGYVLCKENEEINRIYFIEKGCVSVEKERKQLGMLVAGNLFGIEFLLFDKAPFTYKVDTKVEFAKLFYIDKRVLLEDVLNYDQESFRNLVGIAQQFYIKIVNKKYKCNIINNNKKEQLVNDSDEENENEEDNDDNNEHLMDVNIGSVADIVGNIPKINKDIKQYQRLEKELDEYDKKLNVIHQQLEFILRYYDKTSQL